MPRYVDFYLNGKLKLDGEDLLRFAEPVSYNFV